MRNISSYQKYSTSETINEKREEANFDIKAFFDAVGEKYEDKGKDTKIESSVKEVQKLAETKPAEKYEDVVKFLTSDDLNPPDSLKKGFKGLTGKAWEEYSKLSVDEKKVFALVLVNILLQIPDIKKAAEDGKFNKDYIKVWVDNYK